MLALCDRPLVVAPMGGGPSTPALVIAAADAGALGFLAGGYKSPDQLASEIADVRAATSGAFGVNVFVPGHPTTNYADVDDYLRELATDAHALGVELGPASWDDDHWNAKAELLVDLAPPLVSFTFGTPPTPLIDALHHSGVTVMVTVTNPEEARIAADSGADCLCVQGTEAGAHAATFTDTPDPIRNYATLDLVDATAHTVDLPLVAAGGIALPHHVTTALDAGAIAVQNGTAFLRCTESGAHPLHKAALIDPAFTTTTFTRSFSGRRARGLLNTFIRDHPTAPSAYPQINNATRPLRSAAAHNGDQHRMSLWAGIGHPHARDTHAADIINWLTTPTN